MDELTKFRLEFIQKNLHARFGHKVDVYRREGYGVLAVPHGLPLHPANILEGFNDDVFTNLFI